MTAERISLARPALDGNERAYVLDCIDSNWISSIGKYIELFERHFADFCGVRHAIATNNGTTAIHLALVGLDLQPGDEVLVPTLTYVATANAVRYCGATPVLVDSDPATLNIDVDDAARRITARTKGILPVHLYGHPADMTRISELAHDHGFWVVEDAAEAHGAEVRGQRVGRLGTSATFSFFGNKIVTTGEGGMVTTDDTEMAAHLRLLRGQGMDPARRYWFPIVGYNYRMTNIQAALGVAQMETVDRSLSARAQIAAWYDERFDQLGDLLVRVAEQPWARRVHWVYNVFLADGAAPERDALMQALDEVGIETRPVFYPMHVLPPYLQASTFPVADSWSARGVTLPMHEHLTEKDVDRVVEAVADGLRLR